MESQSRKADVSTNFLKQQRRSSRDSAGDAVQKRVGTAFCLNLPLREISRGTIGADKWCCRLESAWICHLVGNPRRELQPGTSNKHSARINHALNTEINLK